MSRLWRSPILPLVVLLCLPGCKLIERIRGGDDEGEETGEDEAAAAEGEAPTQSPDAVGDTVRSIEERTGPGRFKHWAPEPAFIDAGITRSAVISEQEAIVASSDGHVGVTRDGATSWSWTRAGDDVVAVTGYPGGPYVQLHAGALSLSDDGRRWRRLPRYSEDTLTAVVAAEIGLVAIGKSGAYQFVGRDGSGGQAGELPNGFAARSLTELNGAVLAWSGKRGYGTTDGTTWTELEALPPLPDGRSFPTRAGTCALGRVDGGRGVVCSVAGMAHGIGAEFAVEGRGTVSLTRDGGESWVTGQLPFRGANSIFGTAGGPYYAVGNSGAIAISKDGGSTWVDQKWEERANLLDGLVDGETVIIVGARGTIVHSVDGAASWEYSQPPITKNLSWIAKVGGRYVASDGRSFIASNDGVDWVETVAVELPGKPSSCGDDGPEDGERCRFAAEHGSPGGLPPARSLTFRGDVGLATGDGGLVAFTRDGGMSWSHSHGFALARSGATTFHVRGEQLLASDGARVLASTDGAASWVEGELPGKPRISAVHITASGMWLATARGGLRTATDPSSWQLREDEALDANWLAIFAASGALYLAGERGELARSEDGSSWTRVPLGLRAPIIDLVGEGDTVWAATGPTRKLGNILLRSDDGGRSFVEVGEVAAATDQPDLRLNDGALRWRDLVSRDGGDSWSREVENYLPGLVEVGDGSGMRITNWVLHFGPDRLYVVTGEGEYDWVRIDSAFTEGGTIQCDPASGCWMLASGVLYRPLLR